MSTANPFERLPDPRTAPVGDEREQADRINAAVNELLDLGAETAPQAAANRVIAKEQLLTKRYEETFGKRVAEEVIRDVLREIPEVEQVVPAPAILDLGEGVDTFVIFKRSPTDPSNEQAPRNTRMLALQGKMFDLETPKTNPEKRAVEQFAGELRRILTKGSVEMSGKPVPLAMVRASERLVSHAFAEFAADPPAERTGKHVADYLPGKDRFRINLISQMRRFFKEGAGAIPARETLYQPWIAYLETIEKRLETERASAGKRIGQGVRP